MDQDDEVVLAVAGDIGDDGFAGFGEVAAAATEGARPIVAFSWRLTEQVFRRMLFEPIPLKLTPGQRRRGIQILPGQ